MRLRSLRAATLSQGFATVCCLFQAAGAMAQPQGMVVTEQYLATKVGATILRQGGNAVDAAVAVGYAEAVVYPCCGNLGGGGFMLIHLASGDFFLDFRERAPLAARENMYLDANGKPIAGASITGWRAAGVPGTVMGLETARQRFGRLSRAQDMAPAIVLARQGFLLDADGAAFINAASHLRDDPAAATIFRGPGGRAMVAGDRLVQPALAQLLAQISRHGTAAFYEGAIPQRVADAAQANNGLLTARDFGAYRAVWRDPVRCTYRGYDIISSPPPSSGGTAVCEVLNILQLHDMRALGFHTPASLQVFAEAERHAFLDRNYALGDPDFVSDDVGRLTSPGYAAAINATIIPGHATASAALPPGTPPHEDFETTQYSITDGAGNGVSVTYTLNGRFGAQVMAPGTGFLMNDEMDDFTTVPGGANMFGLRQGSRNNIAPGKRPLSSMAPTMVTRDGKLVMVLGSPNGSRIISVVLQVLINMIDYQMSPLQAVSAPRVHEQYQPDVLFAEPAALSLAGIQILQHMGYAVKTIPPFGAAETIAKRNGQWIGVNDPRSHDGSASGG